MNNILIIGNGGRENSLAWKLRQSPNVSKVYIAPGNPGAENAIDISPHNPEDVVQFCEQELISMVVIGPEVFLANGLTDELSILNPNIKIFGPTREAAMLETSKIFAKEFMVEFGLPTAEYCVVTNEEELESFFDRPLWENIVVKADGLSAGKGVIIPKNANEGKNAVQSMLTGSFGEAGKKVIIEDQLKGYEISALAFVDGKNFSLMPFAKDHKRLLEGDNGPNTGGMGIISPIKVSDDIEKQIREILSITLQGLQKRGVKYCGVLYAGLMVVQDKVYLLEFNCRFGDPETQILMRQLESDFYNILLHCICQTLNECDIKWSTKCFCGIVLASENYPRSGSIGLEIKNIPNDTNEITIFYAGVHMKDNKVYTNGGRILCITTCADDFPTACRRANCCAEKIEFAGKQFRRDIGDSLIDINNLSLSYDASGVNISEGNQFVEDIKLMVEKTLRPGMNQIGGFGAIIDLKKSGLLNNSELVIGMDGVGTKIEIATLCQNYSQIGQDLVAMCVNDVICHCAKPIAFLDYFVCGKLNRTMAKDVLTSISDACVEAGCSLVGGETAEMPGVYHINQWDIAGCAIGNRDVDWPSLPNMKEICEGDVVVGLPSSGLHSNGFSLLRKVIQLNEIEFNKPVPWNKASTFGDEFLIGTRIYVKSVLHLLISGLVKGCAHITGGGLLENAARVLDPNSNLMIEIDCSKWKIAPIFEWIASSGPVDTMEMLRTFNCGIGMVLIIGKNELSQITNRLEAVGEQFYEIGRVMKSENTKMVHFINPDMMFDRKKYRSPRRRIKVAILISGVGTNMKKLIEKANTPDSKCEIAVVISNKESAGGLKVAQSLNIPTRVVPHTDDRITGDIILGQVLEEFGVELICLGGYMRILSEQFVKKYPSRIINIHPSLLPSFKGPHALKDAIKFGAKVIGCTAHFVDELVDHGDIIDQRAVQVEEMDTEESLRIKIQQQEHSMFPIVMEKVAARILKEMKF